MMLQNAILKQDNEGLTSNHGVYFDQYKTIGEHLSILEASTWSVGITFPVPSSRTKKRRINLTDEVEDYLQLNLVNVSTEVLESYLDDLRSLPLSSEANQTLYIDCLSDYERFGITAYIIAALAACVFGLLTLFSARANWIIIAVTFSMCLILWAISLGLGSEYYRRNTFIWYINKELVRRKGGNMGQTATPLNIE